MDKLTIIIRMIGGRRIAGLMGNVLNRIRTTIDSPRVSLGSRVPSSGPLQNDRFVATTKKGREREVSIRGQVSNILGTPRVQLSKDWEIKNLLRKEEGFNKLKVYGDRPTFTATGKRENYPGLEGNKPTVGVGHLVQEDKEILAGLPRFGDLGFTVDFKDKNLLRALDPDKRLSPEKLRELYWNVVFGLKSITPPQEDKLLDLDIKDKTARVEKDFTPKVWKKLPSIVQSAVLNGYFRGGLSGSPKAIEHMKAGEWRKAAIEYLDHGGYRRSLKGEKKRGRGGLPLGIAGRMQRNAAIFYLFGKNPEHRFFK